MWVLTKRWLLAAAVVGCVFANAARVAAQEVESRNAPCDSPTRTQEMKRLLRQGAFVDAHVIAQSLFILCEGHADVSTWHLLDAYALLELDETARGRALLSMVAAEAPRLAPAATTLLAWSHLETHEGVQFRHVVMNLDAPSRARMFALSAVEDEDAFAEAASDLSPSMRARARSLHGDFLDSQDRSPALAGILSALVPGLGQVYAGSLESGAIALVLNGVFIAATVELAIHDLYLTAAASGLVSSVFYVGNILNAVDLANRRNEVASSPARARLERLLLPHGVGALR